ncbi:MAG: hypothetical protein AXA67_12440 [Methylothermaceae bacteria B42]|nr:MAG: hypothetical protein AXA67_12440 [Methylothermaceae bacteria B42]HHJ37961.1 hypothetical protein [Methylothermaceae bacterium]
MEINWSTFVLEIINFLVLVWLLKRFLYLPVKQTIERRQQAIEARLTEADRLKQEAEAMKARYENRLADWEKEKKQAWKALQQEIEAERQRRLQAIEQELAEVRKKAEVVWEQEKREWRRHAEQQALKLGAAFVAKLLERLADEHLHQRLITLLLEDLHQWPKDHRQTLRREYQSNPGPIRVISAYPLSTSHQQALTNALEQFLGDDLEIHFVEDASLMAGVRMDLGAYVIRANLKDELEFFAHGHL